MTPAISNTPLPARRWATGAALLLAAAASPAADGDALSDKLKLVKASVGPNASKPAELVFNREDGSTSTLLNAAVLLRDLELPGIGGVLANSWGLSAAVSKNTLSGKQVETLTAGIGARSRWSFSADKQSSFDTRLDALFENDRQHGARGRALVIDSTLRTPLLHLDPNLGPGQSGVDAWLYPSLGYYQRRVSSTDDAATAPVGRHGGASVGLHFTSRLLLAFGDGKTPLFDRVSVDLAALATRDTSVSGGYPEATYRWAELSVDYLLFGSAVGKGWKPRIVVSRTKGTNRPANDEHQDATSIAFKLSYGI